MRRDWDARAQRNWRYYVAVHACSSEEVFRASGEEDYKKFVRGFLHEAGINPADRIALEIGCGPGRMTEFFARDFRTVIALDVSREMLALGRRRVTAGNILWLCGDGTSLGGIADHAVDFVFSYGVLQHIPNLGIVANYLKEAARVTKPGGWFAFQIMNHPHLSIGSWKVSLFVSRRYRVPRLRVYKPNTWDASPMRLRNIRRMCRASGLQIMDISGRWTQNTWLRCRKTV